MFLEADDVDMDQEEKVVESLETFGKNWVFCQSFAGFLRVAGFLLVFSWFSSTHHEKLVFSQSSAGFQNMSILKFQSTLNY